MKKLHVDQCANTLHVVAPNNKITYSTTVNRYHSTVAQYMY